MEVRNEIKSSIKVEMKSAMEGATEMICVSKVASEEKATIKEIRDHGIGNWNEICDHDMKCMYDGSGN